LKKKRIARKGDAVFKNGTPVGTVTSGTFSPTLNASIALALVDRSVKEGDALEVELRGQRVPAEAVKPRFVRRKR